MSDLIRWEPGADAAFTGYAGTRDEPAFQVWRPDPAADQAGWRVTSRLVGRHCYRPSEAEVKSRAQEMLREYASSLGALFAADLRKHLEEQVATEQELGDDYTETDMNDAYEHWGAARGLRETIKHIDREAGRMCRGGCGCRLGTDDADRRECGCDEGCCEEEASQ
jgi:hypothetical protein